jgi:hypothetical protein
LLHCGDKGLKENQKIKWKRYDEDLEILRCNPQG